MEPRHAPATARNRTPILEVLRRVLPESGLVLEVASGTGEHAAFFASRLRGLRWQPTDRVGDSFPDIRSWAERAGASNVLSPLVLDVEEDPWPVERASAVVCINMIHISPWSATLGLLDGAERTLEGSGVLYLYGPYKRGGTHTAPSNEAFDGSLRARNPEWGVRDVEDVAAEAATRALRLVEIVEMPANNLSLVFRRAEPALRG